MDLNKAVPPWRRKSCPTEKVKQHDENAESSKAGCKSLLWEQGRADEQTPALICDSFARRILHAAAIQGSYFAHREQNSPPQIFVGQIWNSSLKFHHPTKIHHSPCIISAFATQWGNPPFQTNLSFFPIVSLWTLTLQLEFFHRLKTSLFYNSNERPKIIWVAEVWI